MGELANTLPFVVKALPFLLLSLPIYFLAKYVEKILKPRKSFTHFLGWMMIVVIASLAYFYTMLFLAKLLNWKFNV